MPKIMRKASLGVAFVVSAASTMLISSTANAQGTPPIGVSSSQQFPAGAIFGECAFPIQLDLQGKAGAITLPGKRSILTSPGLKATLTNLTNQHSVTLNVTGVFHQSTNYKGDAVTVVSGRNLLGDPDAGFVLAIGSFSYVFDAAGNLVQPLAGTGQMIKICPLIS